MRNRNDMGMVKEDDIEKVIMQTRIISKQTITEKDQMKPNRPYPSKKSH